ncbi:AB hydrolase-1 domain-containing protein [Mycena venus]|uniref:AB hydrolase-1 domain-containing protein n=1 Tax=Mycena venus TaxID=2733690 RepID=A0A8H7CWV4_9AGAR|nr:AB hydrolase-1 domain-containing protein [Mycena venus]
MAPITTRTKLLTFTIISLSSVVLADSDNFDWNSVSLNPYSYCPDYKISLAALSVTLCLTLLTDSSQVPLDYTFPAAGNASIAITRYPSNSSKSDYLGPVLLNPGGPGLSGVDYVVGVGADIATALGDEFDIVGFDPRGVSYSTPIVSWFKTEVERALWMPPSLSTVYPSLNESSEAVAQQWARAQVQGQFAAERNQDYMQHMTTDNIARDMLRITEAFGWEKLQYWGISYGSVLGSTFASMFPDKVGRLVVDGVLDMESWYSANLTSEMVDLDKALKIFADGCYAAGPENCAFYASSSAKISANISQLLDSVKTQPVPVMTLISYNVFGYTLLKNVIFDAFYTPYQLFAPLAQSLADLAKGNASTIYTMGVEVPHFECESNSTSSVPFHENTYEAGVTIACGDVGPVNDTVSQLQDFYSNAKNVSNSFADLVSNWRVWCSTFRSAQYELPIVSHRQYSRSRHTYFGCKEHRGSLPWICAVNVRRSCGMSPFLAFTQLSPDPNVQHTSVNAPSICVYGYLRQYFRNGTLPAIGTVCTPDNPLFPSSNSTDLSGRDLTSRSEMLHAGRAISDVYHRITSAHKSRV